MTRLARIFRNLIERLLARFHEGPQLPPRFLQEVRMFRVMEPLATSDQWERFTCELVRRSYRDGFTRGYEWLERSWEGPPIEPERLLEMEQHDRVPITDPHLLELMATAPRRERDAAEARDIQRGLLEAGRVPWRAPGRRER